MGVELSEANHKQHWVPPGFAHGFQALSEGAEVLYKTTNYYAPDHERCIAWNDPDLAIGWPSSVSPLLSPRDNHAPFLSFCELPDWPLSAAC